MSSVKVTKAARGPICAGVNTSLTVQLAPGARPELHVVVCANSEFFNTHGILRQLRRQAIFLAAAPCGRLLAFLPVAANLLAI
jgi:hypothetical protein